MVENEYKYVVKKEIYDKFLAILEKIKLTKKEFIQVNYYYDTKDFSLCKNGVTVRIRQIDGSLELQVKEPKSICEFSSRNEYAQKVDGFLESIKRDGKVYSLIGDLVTHRVVFEIDDGTEIMFDKNYYYGVCDYEVEIEFTKKISVFTNNIITELGENCFKKNNSKYKRFVSAVSSIKEAKDMIL